MSFLFYMCNHAFLAKFKFFNPSTHITDYLQCWLFRLTSSKRLFCIPITWPVSAAPELLQSTRSIPWILITDISNLWWSDFVPRLIVSSLYWKSSLMTCSFSLPVFLLASVPTFGEPSKSCVWRTNSRCKPSLGITQDAGSCWMRFT